MKKLLSLFCSVLLLLTLLLTVSLPVAAEELLTTDKTTYTEGEDIMVTAVGSGKDWVGIYQKNDPIPEKTSIRWYYVAQDGNTSGAGKNIFDAGINSERSELAALPAGEYTLFLFENDGYNTLAQVDITVVPAPTVEEKTLSTDKNEYTEGEPILVTATGDKADWVGIYQKNDVIPDKTSIRWYYVAKNGNTSGTVKDIFDAEIHEMREELASLPAGEYTVYLFENDGYTVLAQKEITVKAAETETPETTEPDDSGASDSPATGDMTSLYFCAALLAGVILTAVLLCGRKLFSR